MTADAYRGVVVVGVDGQTAGDAVDWAAAEAAARESPLLVVHAFRCPPVIDPYGLVPAADAPPADLTVPAQVLRAAVRRARSVAPELELSAQLLPGSPSRVLPEHSRHAALLVVGGRRLGVRGRLSGTLPEHVAARAACPVVVRTRPGVHPDRPDHASWWASPPDHPAIRPSASRSGRHPSAGSR